MTLQRFSLEVPEDLGSALDLLERHGDAAMPYMGGTELLLVLKLGLSYADVLVDLKHVPELRGITEDGGVLRIGAACTHREVESSPVVRRSLPALAGLATTIGNARVRNAGTLGGNLCFAEPHSDPATLLMILDTELELASRAGTRRCKLDEFLAGPLQTTIADGEALTAIRIPVPATGRPAPAFERIAFHERPVANAAVLADGDDVRIAVGAVGGTPVRAAAAEDAVRQGKSPAAVADAVMATVEPLEDAHGSEDYKRHLAGVAVTRCLQRALAAA